MTVNLRRVAVSDADWVVMTFDPEVRVNVRHIIGVMRGDRVVSSADQWLDIKEQVADMLEQFVELRRRVAAWEDDGR